MNKIENLVLKIACLVSFFLGIVAQYDFLKKSAGLPYRHDPNGGETMVAFMLGLPFIWISFVISLYLVFKLKSYVFLFPATLSFMLILYCVLGLIFD